MEIEIKKNILLNKILLVSLIGSKISELSNYIFFKIKENVLELQTCDLEINIKTFIEVESKTYATLVIPSKKFIEILKNLPNETIMLKQENNILKIMCGEILYKLYTIDAQNFPVYPEITPTFCLTLSSQLLQDLLLKTQYAMATESVRYVLHGLFLKKKEDKLIAVSTDGHRLALYECKIEEPTNFEVIIPYKTVLELIRILKEQKTIKIGKSDNQLIFIGDNTQIISRCIEADYPNYEQAIPKHTLDYKYIELEVERLLSACQRVDVMSPERVSMMKINISRNSLLLSTNTPTVGEAQENIPIDYNDASVELIINPRYIIEALKVLDLRDKVTIAVKDATSAVKITANGYTSVIMPMRL